MNRIITVAAPKPPERQPAPTDAERMRRALEQLRRNLLSAAKQVETIQEMHARREMEDRAA